MFLAQLRLPLGNPEGWKLGHTSLLTLHLPSIEGLAGISASTITPNFWPA
jgi:hypothetical protein